MRSTFCESNFATTKICFRLYYTLFGCFIVTNTWQFPKKRIFYCCVEKRNWNDFVSFFADDLLVPHSRCSDRDRFCAKDEVRDQRRSVVSGRCSSIVQKGGDAGQLPQHRNQQPLHGHAIHEVRFFFFSTFIVFWCYNQPRKNSSLIICFKVTIGCLVKIFDFYGQTGSYNQIIK